MNIESLIGKYLFPGPTGGGSKSGPSSAGASAGGSASSTASGGGIAPLK
jgi:hypothetical protein